MPTNITNREATEVVGVGNTGRRVRDVSDTISYTDPNENPFVLLSKEASRRTVYNSTYEWMEKDLPTKAITTTSTGNSTTTLTVTAQSQYVFPGDILMAGAAGQNGGAELVRVASITDANTINVDRAVGSVTAQTWAGTTDLFVIGNGALEGGSLGTPRSVLETLPYNYTQIHRQPFGTTGTEAVSENYGGRDRPRLIRESAIYHLMDIERAFINGQRKLATGAPVTLGAASTTNAFRLSGGFLYWVTTNVQDAGGTLTEPELETFCQTVFNNTGGSDTRMLFCAPGVVSVLDQLGAGRLQFRSGDDTLGLSVATIMSAHGTLNVVKHRLLVNGAQGTGLGGHALAVERSKLTYVSLRERDTTLREDVGTPGDDAWTSEFLTECGFQIQNQLLHGFLKNVTS